MLKHKILRKVLAVSLAAAMIGGTGFTTVGQFVGTGGISVNAAVYNGFKYTISGKTVKITGYTGSAEDVQIPSEINGRKVTSIQDNAFRSCTSAKSITIPDTVYSISSTAFRNCPNLTSINVAENNSYAAIQGQM